MSVRSVSNPRFCDVLAAPHRDARTLRVYLRRAVRPVAGCLLLSLAATSVLYAQEGPSLEDSISTQVRQVFQERSSAVVRVEATDRHGRLCGTGFFADPSGTVYTLSSTVSDAEEVVVIHGGKKLPARVLLSDPRSGVALLKVQDESPFIPVGSSHDLRLASPVIAIGYPMDLDLNPSFGTIGGFDRKFLGKFFVTTHLRVNLPVQAGFGGAPLLNMKGEVIGMVIAGLGDGSLCFVLPIEAVEKVRSDYVRYGEVRPGWVGVNVKDEGSSERPKVVVAQLGPDTPASQSGLREGDVLLQVGNVPITCAEDVLDASFFLTAGDPVTINFLRDGQPSSVTLESINHPANDKGYDLHAADPMSADFNLLTK